MCKKLEKKGLEREGLNWLVKNRLKTSYVLPKMEPKDYILHRFLGGR